MGRKHTADCIPGLQTCFLNTAINEPSFSLPGSGPRALSGYVCDPSTSGNSSPVHGTFHSLSCDLPRLPHFGAHS